MPPEYIPKCGDIFLCDSDRTAAKMVKFLMQSPTVWQQIWRAMRGTLEPVRYYHAGMVLDIVNMIEQQWKVQLGETNKILSRKIIIYRMKGLSISDVENLRIRAEADYGKIYDIPQLIGKTLTWLTGIKLFVRILSELSKEEEICVTRDADWYWPLCKFGCKTRGEITTKIMDEYCMNHPEEWEVVYQNA